MTKSSFNITSKTLMAKGWSSLWQMKVDARLSNGTHVELDREVADHGHGASILPIDRERGTVLLVRQWRAGPGSWPGRSLAARGPRTASSAARIWADDSSASVA